MTKNQKIDFMKKASFIANKSYCGYKIGCVGVVKDFGQKISPEAIKDNYFRRMNGYIYLKTWNETLPGEIFCTYCDIKSKTRECVRIKENLRGKEIQKVCSIHAEQNLIAKCAKYSISTNHMKIFITNTPCYICAKSIVQSGINEVYYLAEHTDTSGLEFLRKHILVTYIDEHEI